MSKGKVLSLPIKIGEAKDLGASLQNTGE